MEPLKNLLPHGNINETGQYFGYIVSDDPKAAGLTPVTKTPDISQIDVCPYCGKPMFYEGWANGDGTVQWYKEPVCRCDGWLKAKAEAQRKAEEDRIAEMKREALQRRIQEVIGKSGMNARFLRRTFDTFQCDDNNKHAYLVCKTYADEFMSMLPDADRQPDQNGLIIYGDYGVGKTHLAAAIANVVMSTGTGVICMTMQDMLSRIKQEFNKRGEGNEGLVLDVYKTVPLLIIDDMGKEQPTEWAEGTIYNIINARYEKELPIVITTNYKPDELASRLVPKNAEDDKTAEAIVDRLHETCRVVEIAGESRR